MLVMSLTFVVSIVEVRFGWQAIQVRLEVMQGRKVVEWAFSASFILVSSFIKYKLERLLDNQDLSTILLFGRHVGHFKILMT